jgi:hypothetical protein
MSAYVIVVGGIPTGCDCINTIEFLGVWEKLYNPDLNPLATQ